MQLVNHWNKSGTVLIFQSFEKEVRENNFIGNSLLHGSLTAFLLKNSQNSEFRVITLGVLRLYQLLLSLSFNLLLILRSDQCISFPQVNDRLN